MEQYEKELSAFKSMMEAKKPKRENFQTQWEFEQALNAWNTEYWCDRPNKPGYKYANND